MKRVGRSHLKRVGRSRRDSGRILLASLLSGALVACTLAAPAFARPARAAELPGTTEPAPGPSHGKEHSKTGQKSTQKSSPAEVPTTPSASQLWATIDVCNAPDQPGAIGIRGSMPGDPRTRATMYMDFQIQYLNSETGEWSYLGKEGESGWQKLGSANLTRQAGRTFQLQLPTPQEAATFTLRGLVSYQWRRGTRVLKSLTRVTTPGHKSLAGADPPGYGAATCSMT